MAGLKTTLLPHQAQAVEWMCRREEGGDGGMLFDDPGLGKTLTVLALLAARRTKTLIVAPSSVTLVWELEAEKHYLPGGPTVHKWSRSDSDDEWKSADAVVVSYRALQKAGAVPTDSASKWVEPSGPFGCSWDRIVLDEAHYVKDHKCKTAKSAASLSGKHRWVVTATPTMNRLDEMYGYLRFLRVPGFESYDKWTKAVVNKVERSGGAGMSGLRELLDRISIRRRKDLLGLPPRTLTVVDLAPTDAEARFQRSLYAYTKTRVDRLLGRLEARKADADDSDDDKAGSAGDRADRASVLKLVLRLRQAALSPDLVVAGTRRLVAYGVPRITDPIARLRVATAMLEHLAASAVSDVDDDAECRACLDDDAAALLPECGCRVCTHCLESAADPSLCPCCLRQRPPIRPPPTAIERRILAVKPELLGPEDGPKPPPFRSSKLGWLVDVLNSEPEAAVGIVSEWTSALDLVAAVLADAGIVPPDDPSALVRLDGRSRLPVRRAEIARFQSADGPRIALLSMMAVGEGVTLTRASRVVLLEPFWNEAKERQAADRAHRIGQTKPVVIWKPILTGSVEKNVLRMQELKSELADGVVGDRSFDRSRADWINNVRLFLDSATAKPAGSRPDKGGKKRPAQKDADRWRRFARSRKNPASTSAAGKYLAEFARSAPKVDPSML